MNLENANWIVQAKLTQAKLTQARIMRGKL